MDVLAKLQKMNEQLDGISMYPQTDEERLEYLLLAWKALTAVSDVDSSLIYAIRITWNVYTDAKVALGDIED